MSNDIAKWVFVRKNSNPPIYLAETSKASYNAGYYADEYDTEKLSEAIVEDVKLITRNHVGYVLTQVTKKQIFEARLKDI